MSQPTNNPIAKLTRFIDMRDLNVPVFNLDGIDYVPARDLVEYAGLTWRSALPTIQLPENKIVYGTATINVALYTGFCHTGMTKNDLPPTKNAENDIESGEQTPILAYKNLEVKQIVCFQLTQSYAYLMSISVRNMKAKGKIESAERLMQAQREWGKVIHDYEHNGIAINPNVKDWSNHIDKLYNILMKVKEPDERLAIQNKIREALNLMPKPPIKPQADLFD